jgi:hypothetical protein
MRDTLYGNEHHLNNKYFNELFLDTNSILWSRIFSVNMQNEKNIQPVLDKILKLYDVKAMVVGHTPQENGIKYKFNNKVICIDTGMSEAFGKKKNKNERNHFIEILYSENKINTY